MSQGKPVPSELSEAYGSNGPQSEVLAARGPERMSRRYWDLDWSSILPWEFDGFTVSYETLDDVLPFIQAHYTDIFNVDGLFFVEAPTPAKRRFGLEMDIFVFRREGQIIGLLSGHPSDWATYYWRTTAILPEFRAQGTIAKFAERSYDYFRAAGVNRMEVDTCPANRATMSLFQSQGFIVTSTAASERWGFTVRFTKFLDPNPGAVFRRQFLDVPR